ncbi:MAG: hypothetical protein MUC88_27165 [Planctomycetes bacterium]|jgi:asparagine N-glycosylation enzyme membrane subunit Stt3|nr:hypothetical protein [Planctomycetota bacterium]
MDEGKTPPTAETRPKISVSSLSWSVTKKVVRIVVGVLLMVLGVVALFTPLTPGSWLIPVGLEVLGLRVLLRSRLRAWANAKPQSRFRRMSCRVLRIDGFNAIRRR